ncbi:PP2C family serine/threonine-protein phosphatase [Rickettsiales endosymbiont of Stachyamoeba lipophora]|uniref:PP2C family serine/threonine-protein phosphatase n=1 Tax=Rickettsiales endosymbiont of Stachyamoeba lipophora TaxID=2486578 RepID=UPI000F6456A0|nr:PP2C family serine/threonine-protein phosphatase [Rickettsiales endosymbiont of Stachyamoeba lipophora]AZL14978.1 protein phosphatase 2C family protein [Rickettsiales endosymbiont of Stachyamoeba lipophora]
MSSPSPLLLRYFNNLSLAIQQVLTEIQDNFNSYQENDFGAFKFLGTKNILELMDEIVRLEKYDQPLFLPDDEILLQESAFSKSNSENLEEISINLMIDLIKEIGNRGKAENILKSTKFLALVASRITLIEASNQKINEYQQGLPLLDWRRLEDNFISLDRSKWPFKPKKSLDVIEPGSIGEIQKPFEIAEDGGKWHERIQEDTYVAEEVDFHLGPLDALQYLFDITEVMNQSTEEESTRVARETREQAQWDQQVRERSPGTTAVTGYYNPQTKSLTYSNVGDSRMIAIISSKDGKELNVVRLTRDHNATDPINLKSIYSVGGWVALDSQRICGNLKMGRAYGDVYLGQAVSKKPDFGQISFEEEINQGKEVLIITSCDGLYERDALNEQKIEQLYALWFNDDENGKGKRSFAEWLVRAAVVLNSYDNITVVVTKLNAASNSLMFAVFDGHAGGECSEIAAKTLKEQIKQYSLQQKNRGCASDLEPMIGIKAASVIASQQENNITRIESISSIDTELDEDALPLAFELRGQLSDGMVAKRPEQREDEVPEDFFEADHPRGIKERQADKELKTPDAFSSKAYLSQWVKTLWSNLVKYSNVLYSCCLPLSSRTVYEDIELSESWPMQSADNFDFCAVLLNELPPAAYTSHVSSLGTAAISTEHQELSH